METLIWRKASYSQGNGNCVETAQLADGGVAVRDSKDPDGPILRFTMGEYRAYKLGLLDGEDL